MINCLVSKCAWMPLFRVYERLHGCTRLFCRRKTSSPPSSPFGCLVSKGSFCSGEVRYQTPILKLSTGGRQWHTQSKYLDGKPSHLYTLLQWRIFNSTWTRLFSPTDFFSSRFLVDAVLDSYGCSMAQWSRRRTRNLAIWDQLLLCATHLLTNPFNLNGKITW